VTFWKTSAVLPEMGAGCSSHWALNFTEVVKWMPTLHHSNAVQAASRRASPLVVPGVSALKNNVMEAFPMPLRAQSHAWLKPKEGRG